MQKKFSQPYIMSGDYCLRNLHLMNNRMEYQEMNDSKLKRGVLYV